MVGAKFRSGRPSMGDAVDGSRSGCLPRLRALATHALADPACATDCGTVTVHGSDDLADLDRRLPGQLLQQNSDAAPPDEPRSLPVRAPSAVRGRNCWKDRHGVDFREPLWMAPGRRLGPAPSE